MQDRSTAHEDGSDSRAGSTVTGSARRPGRPGPALLAVFVVLGLGLGWLLTREPATSGGPVPQRPDQVAQPGGTDGAASLGRSSGERGARGVDGERSDGPRPAPDPLLAAERFAVDPRAETLGDLLASIGGLDALVLGEVDGSFDLLRFDPLDSDRLLASMRSSYGDASNEDRNELWTIGPDAVIRELWAPRTAHDFAHFNADGTITMWVPDSENPGLAPRTAVTLAPDGSVLTSSEPVHASRFAATGGILFALTNNGDYYANDGLYQDLIADTGAARVVLDSGRSYGWIDNPSPELLVAYPHQGDGVTAVWDATTLERLDRHPLAGRPYRRLAISGDRNVAVAVDTGGSLVEIDPRTGDPITAFGTIDVAGVDRPITLSHDGRIAVTVERTGLVTLRWVGSRDPIAAVTGDAAQPRWVDEHHAARSASTVAADASRIALRSAARPRVPVTWSVLDTDPNNWIALACRLAGRRLLQDERQALGLPPGPVACP